MTTVAGNFGDAKAYRRAETHVIDVRCSASLPRTLAAEGRCQLFAGHEGSHAVMFARCGRRAVRLWTSRNPAAAADAGPEALQQRPWMFGFPVPAWFETDVAADPPG